MSDRAVILLSGGLSSFVAARFAKAFLKGEIVEAVCFDYGQQHSNEVDAAAELAQWLDIPFSVFSPTVGWEMSDRMTVAQAEHMVDQGRNESFWHGRTLMIHLLGASRAHTLDAKAVITGSTLKKINQKALDFLQLAIKAEGIDVTFEFPFLDTPPGHAFKVAHELGVFDEALLKTIDCLTGEDKLNDWGRGCGECQGCKDRIADHAASLKLIREEHEKEEPS